MALAMPSQRIELRKTTHATQSREGEKTSPIFARLHGMRNNPLRRESAPALYQGMTFSHAASASG
jgi:hypothetical protein